MLKMTRKCMIREIGANSSHRINKLDPFADAERRGAVERDERKGFAFGREIVVDQSLPHFHRPNMDIQTFREDKGGNPEMVRESQRRRFKPVEQVDVVIAADEKWRAGTSSISL